MRRSLLILLGIAAIGVVVFLAAFRVSDRLCAKRMAGALDDLDWLRLEFKLSDAELTRVRTLHEGYLPRCREYCDQLAAKQRELSAALADGKPVNAQTEQLLRDIGEIRARCQADMLRHFAEVAAAMPSDQGQRYLATMQQLTLRSHEQTERAMSAEAVHSHVHPGH
jgi:hypothetical protein